VRRSTAQENAGSSRKAGSTAERGSKESQRQSSDEEKRGEGGERRTVGELRFHELRQGVSQLVLTSVPVRSVAGQGSATVGEEEIELALVVSAFFFFFSNFA